MSTKVYVAYRLKQSKDIWPFVRDTRRRGEENVKKVLRVLHTTFSENVDTASKGYANALKFSDGNEARARLKVASEAIREGYRAQLGRMERSIFDFDVSVAIREHKGRMYLIPHCDMMMRDALKFLARDRRLENFAYWNNTDQPKRISRREWDARGEIWDALDASGWGDYVTIIVCDWSKFYMLDPWLDMTREMIRKEKAASRL